MAELGIDLSKAGLMMSVFALVGIFISLPSGFIVHKLGLKPSGIIAVASLFIGSFIGWFAEEPSGMLTSRIIEGIGMCLISVVAPAVIAAWFAPEKRGMPMGIWSTWVALGSIVMLLVAPMLNGLLGWKSVWAATTIYTAVILCLMVFPFRMPTKDEAPHYHTGEDHSLEFRKVYSYGGIWLLSAIFLVFNVMVLAVCSFTPLYLESSFDYSRERASAVTSLFLVSSLISGPVTGFIIHRYRIFRGVLVVCMLILAATIVIPFHVEGSAVPVCLFLIGAVAGMIPPVTFSAVPEVLKDPKSIGVGMSVVAFGQYLGMGGGPLFFGGIAEKYGWEAASYSLVPVLLVGVAAAYFLKIEKRVCA
jgi:predicted MFS family arabinose efflux permease